jgi:hypothetical protein
MTIEEIRTTLAAEEMHGIARWHMVKTLLAEVDRLRAANARAHAHLPEPPSNTSDMSTKTQGERG